MCAANSVGAETGNQMQDHRSTFEVHAITESSGVAHFDLFERTCKGQLILMQVFAYEPVAERLCDILNSKEDAQS